MATCSSVPTSDSNFSSRMYENIVRTSFSSLICQKIQNINYSCSNSRNMIILKRIGEKISMVPLCGFAVIECVARLSLSLIAFTFSYLTFFSSSISNKAFRLGQDLCNYFRDSLPVINQSLFTIIF
jgi:hypothetical protein